MIYNVCRHISGDTWKGLGAVTLTVNGSAMDLTGAYAEFIVKYSTASPHIFSLTTNNSGIIISNPLSGILVIPPTIVDIPPGKYGWYLNVKLSNSEIKTYLRGTWEIITEIPEATDYERRNY
jgi:hypothetical protein